MSPVCDDWLIILWFTWERRLAASQMFQKSSIPRQNGWLLYRGTRSPSYPRTRGRIESPGHQRWLIEKKKNLTKITEGLDPSGAQRALSALLEEKRFLSMFLPPSPPNKDVSRHFCFSPKWIPSLHHFFIFAPIPIPLPLLSWVACFWMSAPGKGLSSPPPICQAWLGLESAVLSSVPSPHCWRVSVTRPMIFHAVGGAYIYPLELPGKESLILNLYHSIDAPKLWPWVTA